MAHPKRCRICTPSRPETRRGGAAALVGAMLGFALPVAGQLTPLGTDFQVNSYTTGAQDASSVAIDGQGRIIVAWDSADSGGNDHSDGSIQLRRFRADGEPLGPDRQVNSIVAGYQLTPALAARSTGEFVIVWESASSAGSDQSYSSIQARRFGADGEPEGTDFQVNTFTSYYQFQPAVDATPQGSFVVAWASTGSQGSDSYQESIQAQRFDAGGNPVGGELQVNTWTSGRQVYPSIGVDDSGGFVVAWTSYGSSGGDDDGYSVQVRRFGSNGVPLGGDFQVNTWTTGQQASVDLAVAASGAFVVAWSSSQAAGDDDGYSVHARRFDASGAPLGDQFQVNTWTTSVQSQPSVAFDASGGFLVSWNSFGSAGSDSADFSVQARLYGADGAPLGDQFQVNSHTPGYQWMPSVAAGPGGLMVATWTGRDSSPGTDSSGPSIQARRFRNALFVDGFETGDTAGWSTTTP